MKAYPYDNFYRLENELPNETYFRREKIKQLGGVWDGQFWSIPREVLQQIKVKVMTKVLADKHCHESTSEEWASENDLEKGTVAVCCSKCDISYKNGMRAKILKILCE